MNNRQLQDRLNRLYEKAKSQNRKCYWKGCENLAINSHILQKNGILNCIASNGHIRVAKTDFLNPELFTFKRSGINITYTFKGFCKEHDNNIFRPIEENEIDFEDYKSQLLFAYRTILNEKWKKEILIDWNNFQMHDKDLKQGLDLELLRKYNEQSRVALNDLAYFENIILSNLESNSEDFIFKVRYIKELEVCLASHYTYETTRERQEYIKRTGKDYELLTDIFISLFPLDGESVLIMGYLKSQQEKCADYVSNFFQIPESELLLEISHLMLGRCEEWACSEQFFLDHIKEREVQITDIIKLAILSVDEDKKSGFNIFK